MWMTLPFLGIEVKHLSNHTLLLTQRFYLQTLQSWFLHLSGSFPSQISSTSSTYATITGLERHPILSTKCVSQCQIPLNLTDYLSKES